MRVLVTGASGTDRLGGLRRAAGARRRGRRPHPRPEKAKPKNPTVNWHAWQASTERPPPEAFAGVDAVVNLIGEEINQRLTDEAKRRIRESRVTAIAQPAPGDQRARREAEGLHRPVRDRLLRGPRRARSLDEESPAGRGLRGRGPGRVGGGRARGRGARHAHRDPAHRPGADQGGRPGQAAAAPFKLGLGGPIAGGEQYMSWIHIDDEVGMILWALDNDRSPARSTRRPRTRSPTASSPRRSGAALEPPRVLPGPEVRRGRAARRRARRRPSRAAPGCCRGARTDLGYEFRPSRAR